MLSTERCTVSSANQYDSNENWLGGILKKKNKTKTCSYCAVFELEAFLLSTFDIGK